MAEPVKMPPMLELAMYQVAIEICLGREIRSDENATDKLRTLGTATARVHRILQAGLDVGAASIKLDVAGGLLVTQHG